MSVAGVFLPCGVGVMPEPVFVGDWSDIQDKVGGLFDTVTTVLGEDNTAVVVGYVPDEIHDGDEMNFLATSLFRRELRGNCVVVWGLDENGWYDGENHDLPEDVALWLCTGLLEQTADAYNEGVMLHLLLKEVVKRDILSDEAVKQLGDDLYNGVSHGDFDLLKEAEGRLVEVLNTLANTVTVGDMMGILHPLMGDAEKSDDESSDEG